MTVETAPARAAPLTPAEIRSILLGLMVGMSLAAIDSTILAPAMSTIGRELGDLPNLPWVITAYLLVSTALTPLYGKLSDIHGRRVMFLIGIGTFVLGSVACALSPTMLTLIAARGLQGVGGAGIGAITLTIVGDLVPPRERAKYQVYMSTTWVFANVMGPVLGGYISEHSHWSVIFWINLPIGAVAWLMVREKLKRIPRHERPHDLDIPGALLLVVASVLLMLALSWGGTRYSWTSPLVVGLGAASLAFWALLVWRLRVAKEPLISLALLTNPMVLGGTVSMAFAMASYIGLSAYAPIFFQAALGLSVSVAGVSTMPLMMGSVIGAAFAARMMTKISRYLALPLTGLCIASLACIVLGVWPTALSHVAVLVVTLFLSLGVGQMFAIVSVGIQASVPLHELGTAMSLLAFMRSLGSALGVALCGTIVVGGFAGAGGIESITARSAGGGATVASVFSTVFFVAATGFVIAFITLVRVKEPSLAARHPAPERAA